MSILFLYCCCCCRLLLSLLLSLFQVFRIPSGQTEPDLVLGEKFVPGKDDTHFCKPTDVAVADNGDFFVSDGYA